MQWLFERLADDHKQMMKMLYLFKRQVGVLGGLAKAKPNYDHIIEILDYIELYPEQWHHPMEDVLYREMLAANPDMPIADRAIVNRLLDEHEALEALTAYLQQLCGQLLVGRDTDGLRLVRATDKYLQRQLQHIDTEQECIPRLAQRYMDDAAWQRVREKAKSLGERRDSAVAMDAHRYRQLELSSPLTAH